MNMDKTKLTYKVARKIYDSYRFLVADFKIKNLKKVTNTKKKIVFISQMSNLWINVDDLYNQLSNDDQFETYVLMIFIKIIIIKIQLKLLIKENGLI